MKKYEIPELYVDEFAPDTMIASGNFNPKNGNAGNNQNCHGCDSSFMAPSGYDDECYISPDYNPQAYKEKC